MDILSKYFNILLNRCKISDEMEFIKKKALQ